MHRRTLRITVLASGEGTTLQSLLDAIATGQLSAEVVRVISNNSDSGALARAKASHVPYAHLSSKTHPNAGDLDTAILDSLEQARTNLVLLAGFNKRLGPRTLARYKNRIFNTHPSLLPKFGGKGMYGTRVYEAVLSSGESETGATIHQVDTEYDNGRVVAQTVVPVNDTDTVETLKARVQRAEKALLLKTLQGLSAGGMKDEITIRAAEAADSHDIWCIHTEAIRSIKAPYTAEEIESWAQKHTGHGYAEPIATKRLFVAEANGRLVGFGQLNGAMGVVERIYVLPSASRNGVGQALMREAERRAVAAGCRRLYLDSSLNAVAFYQRCGFVRAEIDDPAIASFEPGGVPMVKASLSGNS